MVVSPGAREHLRAERCKRFFADVVDPMIAQAEVIGIPLAEVVGRIEEHAGKDAR